MIFPISEGEQIAALLNERIGTDLVHEAHGMRVWHLCLAPGETLPAHRHDRPYFWTVLTNGCGRSRYADGRIVELIYHKGDTQYFPSLTPENAFVHDLTNTGSSELIFVTVEFERLAPSPARRC